MNRNKIKIILFIGIVVCFSVRLLCGVFEHDEFGYDIYFIKHRPTLKWRFYSPRGMSDLEITQMTVKQKTEQLLFDKYVGTRIPR